MKQVLADLPDEMQIYAGDHKTKVVYNITHLETGDVKAEFIKHEDGFVSNSEEYKPSGRTLVICIDIV